MKELLPKRLAIAALFSLAPAIASAQNGGAAFLMVPCSARAYALGQTTDVTALGAQSSCGNPANLGLMPRRFEASSSYATMLDGLQYGHLSAAVNLGGALGPVEAVGFSVTRLQSAGIAGYDAQANAAGSFGTADTAVSLSADARLAEALRLGISGKVIQSELAGYRSSAGLAADLGASYTFALSRPLTVAAGLSNVGRGVRFLDQTDPLPASLNAGAAVPIGPALAALEIRRRLADRKNEFGMGLEYGIGPASLRAGFLAQNQAGNLAARDQSGGQLLAGLSGGVGIHLGIARIDYAVSQEAVEFGATHRLSLSLQWGGAGGTESRRGQGFESHPDRSDWLLRSMGSY